MRHANKTVTVYHKEWNEESAVDAYRGTVLSGVSFFSRISTAVSKEGQEHACEAVLRIPVDVCPTDLSLKNGDLVCEGALQTGGIRLEDPIRLCDYVFTVVGVTRNTSGREPHIKVVCK